MPIKREKYSVQDKSSSKVQSCDYHGKTGSKIELYRQSFQFTSFFALLAWNLFTQAATAEIP